MSYVCKEDQCTGCMLCVKSCPHKAIKIEEKLSTYNAVIDMQKCTDCGLCQQLCQVCHPVKLNSPFFAIQGWAKDELIRKESASGGFAASISKAFLEIGGLVCSCYYQAGEFLFKLVDSYNEAKDFVGSKYVKSNPQNAYDMLGKELKSGKKCLFIGLPCQVAAIKMKFEKQYTNQLYTVDLICHGTPSNKLLELFLYQHNINLKTLDKISFRKKSNFGICASSISPSMHSVTDCYTIAFLNSLTYTKNCYNCRYATLKRVGDITLGDSWGTELSTDEQSKGISLALCQTVKGMELLQIANIETMDVDLEKAIKTNHQLEYPSICPHGYANFFSRIQSGCNFDRLIWKQYPKQCFRQFIKKMLIWLKMYSID